MKITRMQFRLVLVLPDGTVVRARTTKKRRISLKLTQRTWTEANLTVLYYSHDQLIAENSGRYTNVPDALAAYTAFTESELVEAA